MRKGLDEPGLIRNVIRRSSTKAIIAKADPLAPKLVDAAPLGRLPAALA